MNFVFCILSIRLFTWDHVLIIEHIAVDVLVFSVDDIIYGQNSMFLFSDKYVITFKVNRVSTQMKISTHKIGNSNFI